MSPAVRRMDPHLVWPAMLQLVFLLSSIVYIPGLAAAESSQAQADPTASDTSAVRIRFYPKKVVLRPGGKAVLSAWACPADDWTPFGKDAVPGSGDDDCDAISASWAVKHPSRAHLSRAVGLQTRVTLDKPRETRIIARWAGMERRARVLVKDAPVKVRSAAKGSGREAAPTSRPAPAPVDPSTIDEISVEPEPAADTTPAPVDAPTVSAAATPGPVDAATPGPTPSGSAPEPSEGSRIEPDAEVLDALSPVADRVLGTGSLGPAATVTNATTETRSADCITPQSAFTLGDTMCAHMTVFVGGGGNASYRVQIYPPGSSSPSIDDLYTQSSGTYPHDVTVVLDQVGTWTALVCKTGNAGECSTGNRVGVATVTITPAPGTIVVAKATDPAGGTGFTFSGDAAGTIDDGGTITVSDLAPGTYTSTETVPAGWSLSAIGCDDTDSGGDSGTATATFVVAAGETVTCTFTNTELGSLVVRKVVVNDNGGEAVATDFAFSVAGPSVQGPVPVAQDPLNPADPLLGRNTLSVGPGTYTVTETIVEPGYAPGYGNCTGVVIDPGETETCIITNDDQAGALYLAKAVINDDGGTAVAADWTLSAGTNDVTGSASGAAAATTAGTYALSESVVAGYTNTSLTCDDDPGTEVTEVTLGLGETITCTFVNDDDPPAPGTIVVAKATDPAGGTGFTFSGDAAGTIDDGGTITVSDLAPGTYTSTETVPAGWSLSAIGCDDTDSGGDSGTATATFVVAAGETVTCTFTNTALGSSIVVEKVTDPSGDLTSFDFTFESPTTSFSLADGESEAFTDLEAGTYSVAETVPAGWTLGDASCDNGDDPSAIDLGVDEVVTCTFTNVADGGTITIAKVTDPSPDPTGTDFTFSGDVAGTIADGGQVTVTDVPPGIYSSTELVPGGWELDSIVCDDDDSSGDLGTATANIVLAPGEDVTCTFTNVAGDVEMVVGKSVDKSLVSDRGEKVTFTFTVGNTGDVAFVITSLEDDVYGTLSGDADCRVGTVLQPGDSCEFEATFTVEPSVTPDPDDRDQVIPDHENTFKSCSILASASVARGAVRAAAGPTGCDAASLVIGFTRTGVGGQGGTPATDMLLETASATPPQPGVGGFLSWVLWAMLGATGIIGAGFVIRRSRRIG